MKQVIVTIALFLASVAQSWSNPLHDSAAGMRAGRIHASAAGAKYCFGFVNWSEPHGSVTWTDYAKAFYNVNQDSTFSSGGFDALMYEEVASKMGDGFCFEIGRAHV